MTNFHRLVLSLFVGCSLAGSAHAGRFAKAPTRVIGSKPADPHQRPIDGRSVATALSVRGGDVSIDSGLATSGILSKENLGTFFAVNGLLLGAGQSLVPNVMMLLLHGYTEKDTPSNKAVRLAGANMLAWGLLPYLTVVSKMEPTKAMGWSIVPIIAHLVVRDAMEVDAKSQSHRTRAAVVSAVLACCAASLIMGENETIATWVVLVLIGSIDVLSILFPDMMMQALEHTTDFQLDDYKLRFVTQAISVHSLVHLTLFLALSLGKDPLTAVGYSALFTAVSNVIFCIIGPNMRKSGAPLGPMVPFLGIFTFISWKLLK
ncbi:hypothetical protein ACHAXT_000861 [Thalassiosira profunda]